MDAALRIVTRLPLSELWRKDGSLCGTRGSPQTEGDLIALLRLGPLQFVIADVGLALEWIEARDCFRFWKGELRTHLASGQDRVRLEDFPGEYCYRASLWNGADGEPPIVVLEKMH